MQQDPEAASAAGAAQPGQDPHVDAGGGISRPGLLGGPDGADRLTLAQ
jgi:hypothetical protein